MRRWASSFSPRRDPLAADEPWVTYPAIAWLERRLEGWMRGFEYGSGGSTLFFGRRVAAITAAEHHARWASRVREAAAAEGLGNVEVLHRPCDGPADEDGSDGYASGHLGHRGVRYESYARSIGGFEDGSLDFVFVDGRSRVACVAHAAPKVRRGGYLILDNANRRRYARAHELMGGHRSLAFRGVGPRVPWRFSTVVWRVR